MLIIFETLLRYFSMCVPVNETCRVKVGGFDHANTIMFDLKC